MLCATAGPRATCNAHSDPATHKRFDDCANTFLATLDNIFHITRHQLRAHQRQLGRIVTIVLVLQLVSKLPILHRAKLRDNISTSSGQKIVRRISYHPNIAYDRYGRLSSDRIGLWTALDRSIRTRDPIVTRSGGNTHERNRRFRGGKLAQINVLPAPDRQHDGWPRLLDRLNDLIQNSLSRFSDDEMINTKSSFRGGLCYSDPCDRVGHGS